VPKIKDSLVIYGWSISKQDEHILKALDSGIILNVAVSVYKRDMKYVDRVTELLNGFGHSNIDFFDSASPGCWNNEQTA